MNTQHSAVALLSGGLDSILAAKLVQEQGVAVVCLHFFSPFFGKPERIAHWEAIYGLSIRPVDVGEDFADMLLRRPVHGFGSVMNPCVDCKILMLRHARRMMEEVGACAIISGEVLGQRPMSQRRDTLNVIRRDAGVKDVLLRPLTALHLEPTLPEREGYIDRSRLLDIAGRGRARQMALAERFGLTEIPTPAGGCRLAERENARSYWPVLRHVSHPHARDFYLANIGRQFWNFDYGPARLVIGRNQEDNDALMALATEKDFLFKVRDYAGPIALARFDREPGDREPGNREPDDAVLSAAAAFMASYSPKAARHAGSSGEALPVRVHPGSLDAPGRLLHVFPSRTTAPQWAEYTWERARAEIKEEKKAGGSMPEAV